MTRTYKNEHSSDGWHVGNRLQRQARPAGRMLAVLEVEGWTLDGDPVPDEWLDDSVLDASYAAAEFLAGCAEVRDSWASPDWCGCYCRRCLLHDDCGGCLEGHLGEIG